MGLKTLARKVVRNPSIGRPCASVLGKLGAANRRARILDLCGYMPKAVQVRIPSHVHPRVSFTLGRGKETDQIAWRLWAHGWDGFERPLPDLFALCAREARTVLDVGANSGLYALIAASVSDCSQVHAFEPLPSAQTFLRHNIELNRLSHRIKMAAVAVADTDGQAELFVPSGNEGLLEMSASLNSTFRPKHSAVLSVPVVTLDTYASQHKLARVDLLKVDVESQEHRVLAGAGKMLAKDRPIVFLEVLADANIDALDGLRQRFDYRAVAARPDGIAHLDGIASDAETVNQILCPAERLDDLAALARAARLPVQCTPPPGRLKAKIKDSDRRFGDAEHFLDGRDAGGDLLEAVLTKRDHAAAGAHAAELGDVGIARDCIA